MFLQFDLFMTTVERPMSAGRITMDLSHFSSLSVGVILAQVGLWSQFGDPVGCRLPDRVLVLVRNVEVVNNWFKCTYEIDRFRIDRVEARVFFEQLHLVCRKFLVG